MNVLLQKKIREKKGAPFKSDIPWSQKRPLIFAEKFQKKEQQYLLQFHCVEKKGNAAVIISEIKVLKKAFPNCFPSSIVELRNLLMV